MEEKWRSAKLPGPFFKEFAKLIAAITLLQGATLQVLNDLLSNVAGFSRLASFISKEKIVELLSSTLFFDDVSGSTPYCVAHVRPYAELRGDLVADRAARYDFITPDVCHDMHDACGATDAVAAGDAWLSGAVPAILQSPAYLRGGVLFIVWDEGVGDDGPIGLIVVSPYAKGAGYANTIRYTHSSTLRTIEAIFGLTPPLGDTATAADLADLFAVAPWN